LTERDIPRLDWLRYFQPRDILGMAEQFGRDDVAIARALCQVTTSRSRPYRRHPAWGRLERVPYADVLALVRKTLAANPA
jgi:hypothetical protein